MADKTVTVGPGKTYATLQAAIAGERTANANLVTMNGVLNIELYAMDDTTAATVSGFTVDATRYVNIYTAAAARHAGYWGAGKYNLIATNGTAITISNNYTRVIGLQVGVHAASDWGNDMIGVSISSSAQGCMVASNVVRNTADQGFYPVFTGIESPYNSAGGHKIFNNIVYGFRSTSTLSTGINVSGSGASYIYNNTVYDCRRGILLPDWLPIVTRNNLVSSCTTPFASSANSDYTSSNNATNNSSFGTGYTNQTGDRVSQTFTFTDATNKNFLLSTSDAGALGYGADLSADSYCPFATDIVGNSRGTPWSIGASQPVSASTPTKAPFWLMMCLQ